MSKHWKLHECDKMPKIGIQIIIMSIFFHLLKMKMVSENENGKFLKTIIPSRKATRDYLGGNNGKNDTR